MTSATMKAFPPANPFGLPVHHLGYAVPDLEQAVLNAVTTLGAGPFFLIKNVPLTTTSRGEPALFVHSAAFGQCGPLVLELMQIEHCEPALIAEAMQQPMPALNHISYAAPAPETARDQLEALGLPEFLHATHGEIEFTMHNARAVWGHNVEIHADNPSFRGFWEQIREASVGWDGQSPIREMAG